MFKKLFFVAFLVTFFNSYSQNLDPLRTDDYYAQEKKHVKKKYHNVALSVSLSVLVVVNFLTLATQQELVWALAKVVFPEPIGPTIATQSPE